MTNVRIDKHPKDIERLTSQTLVSKDFLIHARDREGIEKHILSSLAGNLTDLIIKEKDELPVTITVGEDYSNIFEATTKYEMQFLMISEKRLNELLRAERQLEELSGRKAWFYNE